MNTFDFAYHILISPSIHEKIAARVGSGEASAQLAPCEDWSQFRPARPPSLRWRTAEDPQFRLPSPEALEDPYQRGSLLHYFANHELLALELMALALVKFPTAPLAFRRGLVKTMYDEQAHLGLYLERMGELGVALGSLPVNDHFWRSLAPMTSPLDFVVRMSLTLEQANLDFAAYYERLFREIGDEKTAAILAKVLEDEIAHVAHGVSWFSRWHADQPGTGSFWQFYCDQLPPSLNASRAKGPLFNKEARLRAGLPASYIEELARFHDTKSRPASLWYFNPACEDEVAAASAGYSPPQEVARLAADLAPLLGFLASPHDIVLCPRPPRPEFHEQLTRFGLSPVSYQNEAVFLSKPPRGAQLSAVKPWGWSPRSYHRLRPLARLLTTEAASQRLWLESGFFADSSYPLISSKAWAGDLAKACAEALPELQAYLPSAPPPRFVCSDWEQLTCAVASILASSLYTKVVVKAPYGASGRRQILVDQATFAQPETARWLDPLLRQQGALIAEAWLDKRCDLSLLLHTGRNQPHLGHSYFLTDRKGGYRGHLLGAARRQLDPELRRFLHQPAAAGVPSLIACLPALGRWVASELTRAGHAGPAGVDCLVYQAGGQLYFRPILEINARFTMGHLALALEKRIQPGQLGVWMQRRCQELDRDSGGRGVPAYCDELLRRAPARSQGKTPLLAQGLVCLNDPQEAEAVVSMLAVGPDLPACLTILGLERNESGRLGEATIT